MLLMRFGRVVVVAAVISAVVSIANQGSAGALSPVKFSGSISCTATGSVGFSPALTIAGDGGNALMTVSTTLSGCSGDLTQSGVTITGGTISGQSHLGSDACDNLTTSRIATQSGTIQWTTTGGSATATSFTIYKGEFHETTGEVLELLLPPSDGTMSMGGSFSASRIAIEPVMDDNESTLQTTCGSSGGLGSESFTGVNGVSSLQISTKNVPIQITSAASLTVQTGVSVNFLVTTTGVRIPTITAAGTFPIGIGFYDNGNGTATLEGTTGTAGTFPLTITAKNSNTQATQSFTLTLSPYPAVSSDDIAIGQEQLPLNFEVTTTGFAAAPSMSESGTLPVGVTFADNGNGTATFGGTPSVGAAGTYVFLLTAAGTGGISATQSFSLFIDASAKITSSPDGSATQGDPFSFTVTTTGYPMPVLTETGALPTGISFADNGNGSATLSGNPSPGTAGTYPITVNATNGIGSVGSQNFVLTVS